MFQNVQAYFKNFAALAVRFLKRVGPFWDIMHLLVSIRHSTLFGACLDVLPANILRSTIETLEKCVINVQSYQ